MTSTQKIALAALTGLLGFTARARAEQMTLAEAQLVAENHVRQLVAVDEWATSNTPQVGPVQPLTRAGQTLGYFCPVKPHGFVVLSLYQEVNPIKAFSDTSDLDPQLDGGMIALFRDDLARDLRHMTAKLGHAPQPQDQLDAFVQLDARQAFNRLAAKDFVPQPHAQPQASSGGAGMDYKEGQILLTTRWHQFPPFNDDCPNMSCVYPSEHSWNHNAVVGCVATGGAQILNYWHFASLYSADWPNMCNYYDPDPYLAAFNTERGTATDTQMAAVAMLSHFVGLMLDTEYGCPDSSGDGSQADTDDLEGVFEDLGYSDNAYVADYDDYDTAIDWYNTMKAQLNLNRVMQMSITGHSIVVDGWKVTGGTHYYHLNYGWRDEGSNTWYRLNNLPHSDDDPTNDFIVTSIVPAIASGAELNATNYGVDGQRYWDRDATAVDTTFQPGNWIQILRSGCYLRCVGTAKQAIRFYGSSGHVTRLYLDGDPAGKTRVQVKAGGLKIVGGGGMAIY